MEQVNTEVKEDPKVTEKYRFGTWPWLKFFLGCFILRGYTARDVAVDGASSAKSWLSATFIIPMWPTIKAKLAAVFGAVGLFFKDTILPWFAHWF